MNHEKRNATIRVTSDEMLVGYINREDFESLVGEVRDILKRNMDVYEKFKSQMD